MPGLADRDWIEEKREDWGGEDDPRFQTEVLGLFPSREANRLVSDLELSACFERHEANAKQPLGNPDDPLYFGIDPAGGRGGDKSTIIARRGARVLAMRALNTATDGIVAELDILVKKFRLYPSEPYTVNFDGSSSFGADLAAALRLRKSRGEDHMTFLALEMIGDKKTNPVMREARCCRLIDAYYLNLQIRLRSDAAIPFDTNLREELLFAEFREDQEDGGSKLIAKRQYRKSLGRSPDLSDALAFAFWEGRVAPASSLATEYARDQADALPPDPAPAITPENLQRENERFARILNRMAAVGTRGGPNEVPQISLSASRGAQQIAPDPRRPPLFQRPPFR